MWQNRQDVTLHEVKQLFESGFPELPAWANDSADVESFKQKIMAHLSEVPCEAGGAQAVRRLVENDGKVVHELSVGEDVLGNTAA